MKFELLLFVEEKISPVYRRQNKYTTKRSPLPISWAAAAL
jgi:hypothetical protein